MFTVALNLKGGKKKQEYRQQLLDNGTRLIFRSEALFTQFFSPPAQTFVSTSIHRRNASLGYTQRWLIKLPFYQTGAGLFNKTLHAFFFPPTMPDKAVGMWPRTSSEEARQTREEQVEGDEQTDRRRSRQHNIGCITMTFFSTVQPACLPVDMWARVTAGQCELAVCCRANTTRENTVAMTRRRGRARWREGWVMTEKQFCSWRNEEGFFFFFLSICRVRRKRE